MNDDCTLQNKSVSNFQHQPSGNLLSVEFKKQADAKEAPPLPLSKYQTAENTLEEKVRLCWLFQEQKMMKGRP